MSASQPHTRTLTSRPLSSPCMRRALLLAAARPSSFPCAPRPLQQARRCDPTHIRTHIHLTQSQIHPDTPISYHHSGSQQRRACSRPPTAAAPSPPASARRAAPPSRSRRRWRVRGFGLLVDCVIIVCGRVMDARRRMAGPARPGFLLMEGSDVHIHFVLQTITQSAASRSSARTTRPT